MTPVSDPAVVDQIHAGIHILIFHPGIGRDVGMPTGGIRAEEVVTRTEEFIFPRDMRLGGGTDKLHAQHRWGLGVRGWGLGFRC